MVEVAEVDDDPEADDVVIGEDVEDTVEDVDESVEDVEERVEDVDDRVETVDETLVEEAIEVVDDTTIDEDVVGTAPCWYISSLFPAPQYSSEFPPQSMLQLVVAAMTLPVLIVFPQ